MSTQTASLASLFRGLHSLHILIYWDCFTVPIVSQSQPSAHILIWAAKGISAFNVTLVAFWKPLPCGKWWICWPINVIMMVVDVLSLNSFIYTSGHCCRWHSRIKVKIVAGSLFVHCKIAYFYSVTAEKWLVLSLPNFVTLRKTILSILCKSIGWIWTTKLKIHAMEFSDFTKDFVVQSVLFVPCSLTVTSTWQLKLTAHCPIGEPH